MIYLWALSNDLRWYLVENRFHVFQIPQDDNVCFADWLPNLFQVCSLILKSMFSFDSLFFRIMKDRTINFHRNHRLVFFGLWTQLNRKTLKWINRPSQKDLCSEFVYFPLKYFECTLVFRIPFFERHWINTEISTARSNRLGVGVMEYCALD